MSARAAAALFALLAAGCTCSPGRLGNRPLDASAGMDANTDRDADADRDGSIDGGGSPDGDGSATADGSNGPDGEVAGDGGAFPRREVRCDDGIDQDGDGLTDCMDPDCEDAYCDAMLNLCVLEVCGGCRGEPAETVCGDGVDDDCDGMTDCMDPECAGLTCSRGMGVACTGGACPGCPEGDFERNCSDGLDGDCDTLIDCADGDCIGRLCDIDGSVCMPPGVCECPGFELCQGFNDDCDTLTDEGCPQALGTCCETTPVNVGGPSGTPWIDSCPMGAALVGLSGQASSRVDQIQPICAVIRFIEDTSVTPEHAFYVRTGVPFPGSAHGATGAPTFTDQCPANEFVIGIEGHADTALDRIQLRCGSFAIRRVGLGWQLTRTATSTLLSRGGAGSGLMPFAESCGPNGLVTGLSGRAGTFVTGFAFTCRTVALDLR